MAKITNIEELLSKVDRKIGQIDTDKLKPSPDAKEEAARDALDEYSGSCPHLKVSEEVGDGSTRRFVLSTLLGTGWIADTSLVQSVAFVRDANTDTEQVEELAIEDWAVRLDTSEQEVLFLDRAAGTDETIRIRWTSPHTINELDEATVTTVPSRDTEALALLAASKVAEWIARTACDMANRAMGIDQVDFNTFDRRWSDKAKRLRAGAIERLNPTELSAGGAGTSVEWKSDDRLSGLSRVSH